MQAADADVDSSWRCVRNSQLVGDSLDESEQICQQRKSSCIMSAVWTHLLAVVTQFTFPVLLVTSDNIMTSLLKTVIKSIKVHAVKPLSFSFQIVDWIRRKLSWVKLPILFTPAMRLDS